MTEIDDPLRQTEAHAYQSRRRRLGLASNVVELAALVAIDAATPSLGGRWAVVLLVVGMFVLGLPFGVAGYRLSRAYGLSRQTPAGWLADRAKGAGVGLVLGAIAAGGLLADELWQTAERARVHVRELRLLKMGEKTAAANAMVAGLGPTVKIYVSDTLAEPEDGEDEAGALARTRVVLAHELGHHVHHDLWRILAVSVATLGAGVAGMWAAIEAFAPHGAGHLSTLPAAVLGFLAQRDGDAMRQPIINRQVDIEANGQVEVQPLVAPALGR